MHAARRLGELMGLFRELVEGPIAAEEPVAEGATPTPTSRSRSRSHRAIPQLLEAGGCAHRGRPSQLLTRGPDGHPELGEKSVIEVKDRSRPWTSPEG